ncbi:hypothetical protein K432DRAFT_382406 [Lepidopterella palustris CBS 459.81]|uniref:Uncharacterized protein n=1 Tax=Lepidopterella palustris CBS 459.81 TaxID=1314670 RepID=A0A8E2JF07_9PEZI|nr:hypothetical protein K432DRAFT_382406 [Lepidopterella palustris CBS 459.81]
MTVQTSLALLSILTLLTYPTAAATVTTTVWWPDDNNQSFAGSVVPPDKNTGLTTLALTCDNSTDLLNCEGGLITMGGSTFYQYVTTDFLNDYTVSLGCSMLPSLSGSASCSYSMGGTGAWLAACFTDPGTGISGAVSTASLSGAVSTASLPGFCYGTGSTIPQSEATQSTVVPPTSIGYHKVVITAGAELLPSASTGATPSISGPSATPSSNSSVSSLVQTSVSISISISSGTKTSSAAAKVSSGAAVADGMRFGATGAGVVGFIIAAFTL